MSNTPLHETLSANLDRNTEKKAEQFFKQYRPYLESLDKSLLSKVRPISAMDYAVLGTQLSQFDKFKEICEDAGTLSSLGRIPHVALEVITGSYASNPLSMIASNQPILEETGSVYYKNVVAGTTRGNVTAGDRLWGTNGGQLSSPLGYAGSRQIEAQTAKTAANTKDYNIVAKNFPVKFQSVRVRFNPPAGATANAMDFPSSDDGQGNLLGRGLSGSINYATGAIALNLAANPPADYEIILEYDINVEESTLPRIVSQMVSKPITATMFALQGSVGLQTAFTMKQRFGGMVADEELAKDLMAGINNETVGLAINKANANAKGNTNWNKASPAGVSPAEWKQTFLDAIADAENNMLAAAGRGSINVLVAGLNASSLISTLPQFVKIADNTTNGPHVFGTLNGMLVIRVQNQNILNANQVLCMYNGSSPFEGAIVHAPYMPLVMPGAIPGAANPLNNVQAIAVWSGIEVLVPEFITRITIV